MREVPLSWSERTSLLTLLESNLRLDGRDFLELRDIQINFGKEYGCCSVVLGETRVLAQVSCEVVEPRPSRPAEGKLSIFVHIPTMAAPHFEPGKSLDVADELQQILDRNIKESKCLDLESLCILAEESVWQFTVDVTVLNHTGNLGDACNLAAVAALRHFHRPDVTVEEDGRVTIHTAEEMELIPTFLKKVPVCLTYSFFTTDNNFYAVIDPTEKEERGEITSLLFPGRVSLPTHTVHQCIQNAFQKAKSLAERVMATVEEDLERRKHESHQSGFIKVLKSDQEKKYELIAARIERLQNVVKMRRKISQEESMNDVEMEVDVINRINDDYDEDASQEKSEVQNEEARIEDITKQNKHKKKPKKLKGNKKRTKNNTEKYIHIEKNSGSEEEFSAEVLSSTLPQLQAKRKNSMKKDQTEIKAEDSEEEEEKVQLTSMDYA